MASDKDFTMRKVFLISNRPFAEETYKGLKITEEDPCLS